jgi:hypothetical protein
MAEHLGCTPEQVAAAEEGKGALIGAIEQLRGKGKTLDPLDIEDPGEVDKFIASNELLDPESPEEMFEPLHKRGLARSWARGRAMVAGRFGRGQGRRAKR